MTDYRQNMITMAKALREKVQTQERGHDGAQSFWSRLNFWFNIIAPLIAAMVTNIGTVITALNQQYGWSIGLSIVSALLSGLSIIIATVRNVYDPQKRHLNHAEARRKYLLLGNKIEVFYNLKIYEKTEAGELARDERTLQVEYDALVEQLNELLAEVESKDVLIPSRVRRGSLSWLKLRLTKKPAVGAEVD